MALTPPPPEENKENHDEPKRGSLTSWIFGKQTTGSKAGIKQTEKPLSTHDLDFSAFSDTFDIIEMIGYGGMGSVYKVRDRQLGSLFALKILHSELAKEPGAVKRFEQEASSASQLTHPNLVAVYKHGLKNGQPFLVMDYVDGESLSSILAREQFLDTHRCVDIFTQVAEAVRHAHDKGVVHRDLKPSNILVSKAENGSDVVKLVDFGIAKVLTPNDKEVPNLTQSGEIFGSPQYMSPEQCLGDQLDCRADLYSLGCVMYESLMGKPPFTANNPIKLVFKHINDPPPPLVHPEEGHQISPGLKTIVLRCLEKDAKDRYQTAAELVRDLTLVHEGKAVGAQKKRKPAASLNTKLPSAAAAIIPLGILAAIVFGPRILSLLAPQAMSPPARSAANNDQSNFIKSFTMQIASHPKDDSWYVMRGTAYREAGEKKRSLDDFTTAIELNPHNAKTYRARAWTYNELGEALKAVADCNTAIKLDPNCPDVYLSRARGYSLLGERQKALQDYAMAIKANPLDAAIYWNRGWVYNLDGQNEKAVADFNQALKMQPGLTKVLVGRAMSYANLQQYDKAEKDLSDYLVTGENPANTLWRRSLIYLADGKYREALEDAENSHAADLPASLLASAPHALALAGLGKTDEAMAEYNHNLSLAPNDTDNLEGRAELYSAAKEYDKALTDLNKALQIRPKFQRALRARAFVYGRLGQVDKAEADLKLASTIFPFSF